MIEKNLWQKFALSLSCSSGYPAIHDPVIKMDQQAMHKDYDTNMSDKDLSIADDKGNKDMPPEFYAYDETFDRVKRDNLQRGIKTFDSLMAMLYQQIWSKEEIQEALLKISEIYNVTDVFSQQHIREKQG